MINDNWKISGKEKKKKGFTWECHERAHRELNLTAVILDTKY